MEIKSMFEAQQFDEDRFTKINIIKNRHSVAFLLNFLPDQHMKEHNHPDRELFLNVLEGNGTFIIDGEEVNVKQGDVLFCESHEQIGFTNTSKDNVSIYAVMTKINR